MLEDSEDPVVTTVQPTIKTDRKWKVVAAVYEGGQKQKGKRKETWSSMRYSSMRMPEGFRKQSSNHNRDNGLTAIISYKNPSHGTRSDTWRYFGSAFSSDQCTISFPQTQIWYGWERKRTALDCHAKTDRQQSMS